MNRRLLLAVVLLLAACGGDDEEAAPSTTTSTTTPSTTEAAEPEPLAPFVLSGQGNDLVAYGVEPPFERHVVVRNATDDPDGRDVNGQICFDPADPRRLVAGEDTDQDGAGDPGWGVFELTGSSFDTLGATQVAKLVPIYQPVIDDIPDNYGCGFLPDGRLLTTDIGNKAAGPPNGQLIVWFPPFSLDQAENRYCAVDVDLATPQQILVRADDVLVAEARAPRVSRYAIADLPTSPDSCAPVDGEPFITPDDTNRVSTPNGIAAGPGGELYVSGIVNGVISEFTADGTFVRVVLEPPAGESLGPVPFSTGSPLGLGVAADGTIFYADLGLVVDPSSGPGPGDGTGTFRRLRFVDGVPQPPETMDTGLQFPDGVGISP